MTQNNWDTRWSKISKQLPANAFAKKVLLYKQGGTLLDLGCGDGKDSLFFAQNGFTVTALDFSDKALDLLRKRASQQITIKKQDVRKMAFPANSFDVVYANLSLHYFNDLTTLKIIKKIHAMLKKGGYLFIRCKGTHDSLYGKGSKIEDDFFTHQGKQRHFFGKEYMAEKLQAFSQVSIRRATSRHYKMDGSVVKAGFIEAIAKK